MTADNLSNLPVGSSIKKNEEPKTEPPPSEYLELDDQDNVYQPNMEISYLRHLIREGKAAPEEKAKAEKEIMELMTKEKAIYSYEAYCVENGKTPDAVIVKEWKDHEETELKFIAQAEQYSKDNLGDSEVRDQLVRRAHFLCAIGAFDLAVDAYNIALEKSIGVSPKLHVSLTIIRIGLAMKDSDLVKKEIKRAKDLLDKGGDWERRNKLKIYEAVYLIMVGQIEIASNLLVEGLSTFSATEFIKFERFVLYSTCLAIIAETRQNYKTKVLGSPEVHQVIIEDPALGKYVTSFYEGNFDEGMVALLDIADRLKADFYFGPHVTNYLMKVRIRQYKTFLQPYKNVKISTMARRFGVTENFIESEVAKFISSGHVPCRIDRVEGVIYANHESEVLAEKVLAEGDLLQTKIEKLSRIIYM